MYAEIRLLIMFELSAYLFDLNFVWCIWFAILKVWYQIL